MDSHFNGPDGMAPPQNNFVQQQPPVQHGGSQRQRETGVVVRINGNKGYGFIRRESGQEIFFHTRSIRNAEDIRLLREEDRVEFQIGFDPKNATKEEAQEVRVLADLTYRSMSSPQPGTAYGAGYGARGRGGYGGPPPPGQYGRGGGYGGRGGGYGQRYDPYGANYGMPPPVREEGPIKSLNRERQYGFVMLRGDSIFFPRSQLTCPNFDDLKEGDLMTFDVIPDPRMPDKWMAAKVRKAFEQGTVDGLKDHYGFINTDNGDRVFFHGRYVKGCTFGDLKDGNRVEFKLVPSRKGGRGERGSAFEAQDLTVISQGENNPQDVPGGAGQYQQPGQAPQGDGFNPQN